MSDAEAHGLPTPPPERSETTQPERDVIVEEAPTGVQEKPVVVKEEPVVIVKQAPTVVEEKPTAVQEQPVVIIEEKSVVDGEKPVVVEEKPVVITEEKPPPVVEEKPIFVQKRPTMAEEQSVVFVEERPTVVEEGPFFVEKRSTAVEEEPYYVEKRPTVVEEKPYYMEKRPTVVEEKPYYVEKSPTVVEEKPYYVEKRPTVVEEKPYYVEKSPTVVEQRPFLVEKRPTTVESGPVVYGERRATVSSSSSTSIEAIRFPTYQQETVPSSSATSKSSASRKASEPTVILVEERVISGPSAMSGVEPVTRRSTVVVETANSALPRLPPNYGIPSRATTVYETIPLPEIHTPTTSIPTVPLTTLGDRPAWIKCPYCDEASLTRVLKEYTNPKSLSTALMTAVACPIFKLPCASAWGKSTNHYCTNCDRQVTSRPPGGRKQPTWPLHDAVGPVPVSTLKRLDTRKSTIPAMKAGDRQPTAPKRYNTR